MSFWKGQALHGRILCFCIRFYFFISRNHELSRRGKTWKREIMARWQATVATHLPLGNPAIMLSGRIDLRERVKETVLPERGRGRDESAEGKTVRFQKWLVWFYHAQWKGDISVMLYSSLWHFKLIKASNNYADWKDGGRVDTLWANTLMNNAAISLSPALVLSFALSISSQFLSISLRWPLHLIVKGWAVESVSSDFLLNERTLRIPPWQIDVF